MLIGLYRCDLCQNEHRPDDYWWNNANGGAITVCRDGVNGIRKWEHLCPKCRAALCSAIDTVVDKLTPAMKETP